MPKILTTDEIAKVAFDLLKLAADVAGDRLDRETGQRMRALVDKLLHEQYRRGWKDGYEKALEES